MNSDKSAMKISLRVISVVCLLISASLLVWFRISYHGGGQFAELIFSGSRIPTAGILIGAIGFAFAFSFERSARVAAALSGFIVLTLWF